MFHISGQFPALTTEADEAPRGPVSNVLQSINFLQVQNWINCRKPRNYVTLSHIMIGTKEHIEAIDVRV
jgi:hypothetical protein